MIVGMIAGGSTYAKIPLAIGKGLKTNDIKNRWCRELKESPDIIKPPKQAGWQSSIPWTTEDHATIVRMIAGGSSYTEIASELGHNYDDIKKRWRRHLKH